MKTVIVSDTTSLIVLEKLQAMDLLCKLFDRVLIPAVVVAEIQVGSPHIKQTLQTLPCLETVEVLPSKRLASLLLLLDAGEANAIELAACRQLPLIIDERKGRQVAQQLGLRVTGFAGLLIQATRSQIMTASAALELLEWAIANGLRLSSALQQQVQDELIKSNFLANANRIRTQLQTGKQVFSDSAELVREDRDA